VRPQKGPLVNLCPSVDVNPSVVEDFMITTNHQTDSSPGLSSLATGIIGDLQELVKHQLALFQFELKEDFQNTKQAALPLLIAVPMALVAGIMLAASLALLLWHVTTIPLWGCFGIAALVWLAITGVCVFFSLKKFGSFNPLPDKTVAAMQENVQWLTKK
jgi:uncharacterized membrane protein YqjE